MGGRDATVLFAGLTDVTLDAIGSCIDRLREVTKAAGGRVVKTIGDEVMAIFPGPDAAAGAAAAMQRAIEDMPESSAGRPGVRIGFQRGPVINQDNDVFGDTVNMAARLAQQAIRAQILTSAETAATLSEHYKACLRRLYAVELKGKAVEVDLCELIWRVGHGTDTFTFEAGIKAAMRAPAILRLVHKGQEVQRRRDPDSFVIGRDPECDLPIVHHLISRRHCSIERRGDKFVLSDQSSNGTFVTVEGDSEFTLQREEFILRRSGCISFGQPRENSEHYIEFFVE
jgi:adenylate cyclase